MPQICRVRRNTEFQIRAVVRRIESCPKQNNDADELIVEKGIGIGIADFNAESTLSALGEALERLPELIKASAVEAKRIRAEDPGYLKPLFFEKLSAEG